MRNTKVVFFGTPDYVIPVLETLHKEYEIAAVVTQPPKPVGRLGKITFSPVSQWAEKRGIPAIFNIQELLSSRTRYDVGIIAAYGKIIPEKAIDLFPKGILNIHPSLLPCWRGASPVEATILAGDKKTGVTIIKIDEIMDHGPVAGKQEYKIQGTERKTQLRDKLFQIGGKLLVDLLPSFLAEKINLKEQEHSKVTFTRLMKKEYGSIPPKYINAAIQGVVYQETWEIPFIKDYKVKPSPAVLERFIRATFPWPGAWSVIKPSKNQAIEQKRVRILKAHMEDRKLVLDQVQLEGKKQVTWKQFLEGYPSHSLT